LHEKLGLVLEPGIARVEVILAGLARDAKTLKIEQAADPLFEPVIAF